MSAFTVTLYGTGGALLVTLLARHKNPGGDAPTRNFEGVQPPGSNRQGVFGDALHRIGTIERDFALCGIEAYASAIHAKAALEADLPLVREARVSGWSLPIMTCAGISAWEPLLGGIRVRLLLTPASAHWRNLTGIDVGTGGSQAGKIVTASGFAASDVGRLIEFPGLGEALITSYISATSVGVDVEQTIPSASFAVYDAVTGLL